MANVLEQALARPTSITPTIANNINNPVSAKKKLDKKVIAGATLGSALGIVGAVAGVYHMAKKGNANLLLKNLAYEEKDVLLIGAGSVLGGLTGGLLTDKEKKNTVPKIREATEQMVGCIAFPVGLLAIGNKFLDKANIKMPQIKSAGKLADFANNALKHLPKVAMTVGCLVAGMQIGHEIMEKVNNKIFKEKENHKVEAKDYLVHTDDLCVAASLIFKDTEKISKVTNKILPLSFILSGIKTGTRQAE